MAPPVFANLEFYNLHSSVTNLERALDDASRQKTARRGARKSSAHQPLEELQNDVAEDLDKVLNSPLRPARGSGNGCLPLEAVQPMRQLHEMLLRAVGPNGNSEILSDSAKAADLHHRVEALVASVDPDHPFLQLELDFEGSQGDESDNEIQPRTSSAKGKGEAVVGDEQQPTPSAKRKGKVVAVDEQQQTPKAKGKGRQVVVTPQGKMTDRIEESRMARANRLLAMSSTCSASGQRRDSSKRTYPGTSYSSSGRHTGPWRLGRPPTRCS